MTAADDDRDDDDRDDADDRIAGDFPDLPEPADEIETLVCTIERTRGVPRRGEDIHDRLEWLPLAGVLWLAVMGTPGEHSEIEPPLLLILRSIRATVEGWASAPSMFTHAASVPNHEIDLLVHRIGAAMEIARRGAPPEPPPKRWGEPKAPTPEAPTPATPTPETPTPETPKPKATKPKATKPKATKPKATKPKATKPKATKPKATSKPTKKPKATREAAP